MRLAPIGCPESVRMCIADVGHYVQVELWCKLGFLNLSDRQIYETRNLGSIELSDGDSLGL